MDITIKDYKIAAEKLEFILKLDSAQSFENLDLGFASAMAVVLLVIVMIFSLINILCFERGKYNL